MRPRSSVPSSNITLPARPLRTSMRATDAEVWISTPSLLPAAANACVIDPCRP